MTVENLQPETVDILRRVFHGQEPTWPAELSVDAFFTEINFQGIAPLLCYFLAGKGPPALLARLRESAMQQAAFELILERDLRALLDAFAEIQVRPLLLKGTPLSQTLYPEPGLRPRCDTDLLIPESAREETAALMKKLGYQGLHEATTDHISYQMSYSKKTQGFICSYDMHWQISNCHRQFCRNFSYDKLVEHSAAILALGGDARTLCQGDALILACFHRGKHFARHRDRLIWLYDIHLLCQALSEQDAKIFYAKAKESEIVHLCVEAILTASSWFKTELPLAIEVLLQENVQDEASALLLEPGRLKGTKNRALLALQESTSWRERFFFLWRNAFPPAEYMAWRYKSKKKNMLPWLYAKRFVEGIHIFLKK